MCWLRLALATVMLAAPIAQAVAEPVRFPSAVVQPTPLQTRLAQQRGTRAEAEPPMRITGELYRPNGAGPFPAVVALHGCAGRLDPQSEHDISTRLTSRGYVVLWPDSFTARGIGQECTVSPAPVDRMLDAYGALDWLAAQTFVDAARIAVLGLAEGGTTALSAASPLGNAAHLSPRHFAAAIAYYPFCHPGYAEVTVPTLILAGELDDRNPVKECRAMLAHRTDPAVAERLLVYPGAHHGFNLTGLAGHPVEAFWHHLEYARAADDAAAEAVAGFLRETLGR